MHSITPTRFETRPPKLLGGLRQRHELAAAETGIAEQWRQFKALDPLPGELNSNLYGVMCGHDTTGFEYMCGVEVESLAGLPEGIGRMRVPAQRYAVFAHLGPASTLRATWQQILEWLSSGPYASAHTPDFEVYGPGVDPLDGTGGIEIWVGVVESTVSGDRP